MGATHALRGDAPILADHITPTAGGGADHAFEVIGLDRLVGRTTKLDGVDGTLEGLRRAVGLRTVIEQGENP